MHARILVVDDKESVRTFIRNTLTSVGYEVDTACDGREAAYILKKQVFDLMITDLMMPNMDGMELLREARNISPNMAVILLTAHGTVETAVAAMKIGAFDYLTKPLSSPDALRTIASRALSDRKLKKNNDNNEPFADMVAEDPKMKSVLQLISKVAATDAAVLLLGESGTGKEIAAQMIHRLSSRSDASFVAINCAAVSDTLVESEMFGHEKGAYTGASEQRIGRFEQADKGTLFLDEVGELPLSMQAKLLRVLQEQKFERVGGNNTISVDVRIIAATNRNLAIEIQNGRFREDLFHRLSVFPVNIPPLRERKADILPLAKFLLTNISKRLSRPGLTLSKESENDLLNYNWPGNVRELGNMLERAVILSDTNLITNENLSISSSIDEKTSPVTSQQSASLRDLEKIAIKQALDETDGHRKKAADKLGIGLRTLYNKLKEYGIE